MSTLEASYTEAYSHPTTREYKTGNAHKTKDEARSPNHGCHLKSINATYSWCVSLFLP